VQSTSAVRLLSKFAVTHKSSLPSWRNRGARKEQVCLSSGAHVLSLLSKNCCCGCIHQPVSLSKQISVPVAADEEIRVPPPRQKSKARPESVGAAAQVQGPSSQPYTAIRSKPVDSQHQQTAADVAAAAGAVAATAAFQVIQAAGKEVQAQLQVLNPSLHAQHHIPCSKVTAWGKRQLRLV